MDFLLAPAVRVQAIAGTAGVRCFAVQHGWCTCGVAVPRVQRNNDQNMIDTVRLGVLETSLQKPSAGFGPKCLEKLSRYS